VSVGQPRQPAAWIDYASERLIRTDAGTAG
jgi:hypothetical protein